MVRKCKEDAEKTRQAILESALDIFSVKGYAKTTFDEIAAHAGFTKGAVYWYFRNKADLVASLIAEYVQRKQIDVEKNSSNVLSLDGLLEKFCMWAQMSQNDLRYAKFNRFILCQMEWSETVLERVDKSLIDLKNLHLEKINKVLVKSRENGELRDDVDIDKMQHVIMSSYFGMMFSSLSKRYDYDVVEMVRIGLGALFNGMKK